MRSITCWTLSRYAHWVVANGQDPHSPGQLQFDLVIEVRFRALFSQLAQLASRVIARQQHSLLHPRMHCCRFADL